MDQGGRAMSDRIIKTISVPRGGKMDIFLEDAKKAGKNVSALVCGIVERHETLYDDNIQLELEMNRLRYRYAYAVRAAKNQLNALTGDDWVIHVPSEEEDNSMEQRNPDFIGLETVIHFRREEAEPEAQ
jgi:hypothetical protein